MDSMWMTIMMIGVVFVVFYFFGIRPQKKQEREAANMRDNLQVGDEITTIGGVIGKIVSIKEETMVIETSRDHTRIRFLKSAVRSVDVHAEDAQPDKPRKATEAPAKKSSAKPAQKSVNKAPAAPAQEPAPQAEEEAVEAPVEKTED